MSNTLYHLALAQSRDATPALIGDLIEVTGSLESIFTERGSTLYRLAGVHLSLFTESVRANLLEGAKREMEFIARQKITPLFFTDEAYPKRLLECADAPLLLYYKGTAPLNKQRIISIVGTRHATTYGKESCEKLVEELSAMYPDITIVSGLAHGIDVAAHRAALRAGAETIGVLAHPLNTLYPAVHKQISLQMEQQGGLLTEYHSQQAILKVNFLARNRIVAGMADATIIVESAEKGGALVTAGIAWSYNRDVFAYPGRAGDTYSIGCNNLIKRNRATLITGAEDVARAMNWELPAKRGKQPSLFAELTPEEEAIMSLLNRGEELHINEISNASNLSVSRVMALLFELECKEMITSLPGAKYRVK